MSHDSDQFDFFVSYARADDRDGWISAFVETLVEEHRKFTGGRSLTPFFDKQDIHGLDDWRLKIYDKLAKSRLFLAFISPNYFASEWCRREWRAWIDLEVSKHILSAGAAPLYIVDVPGLLDDRDEQEVARCVADMCGVPAPRELFLNSASSLIHQLRRRQFNVVQPFYRAGTRALLEGHLRNVLEGLARDLDERAEHVKQAANSESTVPPYNRNFSGRTDELLDLRERLKDDRAGVITSLQGLGGVGKTELAFTYAHAFAGAYPGGRFLVPCEGKRSLREAALVLGEIFRDRIDDQERMAPESYFGEIMRCLRQRIDELGHVLLVLDNVTEPGLLAAQETDVLTSLGPTLHLLATTRLPAARSGQVHWITLGELPKEEALELLEKYRSFATSGEREAAERIVRRLGGFALTVELVGAWLANHPDVSCADFLERLGLEELEALDALAEDSDATLRRHNHERRLEAVLGPALDGLNDAEQAALEYAACLSPDSVPLPWLRELVGLDFPDVIRTPRPGHSSPWESLCRRLLTLALFSRADGEGHSPRVVRVHRLVQDLVLRAIPEQHASWRQQAIENLVRQRDAALQETTRWQENRWEIEPLDALAGLWADSHRSHAAWLLNQVGDRWHSLAEWTRAEPLLRRALAIYQDRGTANDPAMANCLDSLAQVLQATNRLAEAEPLYRQALAIDEQSLGPEHPTVARDLNNLALLLKTTNRMDEAESLMRGALLIVEQHFGPDDPKVAIRLNNLAMLLQTANRLDEAEPLYRRALAINETAFPPDHPVVGLGLSHVAHLLQAKKCFAEAERLMRRALVIDEQSYGPDHPNVARNLNNLATLLRETDRLAEAERLMRRALCIDEQAYGADHPSIAVRLNNLAQLHKAMNRPTEAEPMMRRALAIDELSYGPDHPKVAIRLNNLAALLKATNRSAEAEPLLHRALTINEQKLGTDHPHTRSVRQNYHALRAQLERQE